MLSAAYIAKKLAYDEESKQLVWLTPPMTGRIAGTIHHDKHVVRIASRHYSITDVAWLIHTGLWPSNPTESVDGSVWDLSLENLRFTARVTEPAPNIDWGKADKAASRTIKPRGPHPTGVKGVMPYSGGRFKAQVYAGGKCKHVGIFATVDEAAAAIAEWQRNEGQRLRELAKSRAFA